MSINLPCQWDLQPECPLNIKPVFYLRLIVELRSILPYTRHFLRRWRDKRDALSP